MKIGGLLTCPISHLMWTRFSLILSNIRLPINIEEDRISNID